MSLPRNLHLLTGAVLLAGALAAIRLGGFAWEGGHAGPLLLLLAWGSLPSASHRLDARLRGRRLSMLAPSVCLAQLAGGTAAALVVAASAALADCLINRGGKAERQLGAAPAPYAALFQLGTTIVAAAAAGAAADMVLRWSAALTDPMTVLLAAGAWAVFFLLPAAAIGALGASIANDYTFRGQLPEALGTWGLRAGSGAPLAAGSLILYRAAGPVASVTMVVAAALVYFACRFYLERDLAARQFDSLLAGARDGVAILQGYTILYANQAFAQILQRPRESVVGTEYPRYLPPHALGWTDLAALSHAGLAEIEMRRPDNSLVRVELSISPVLYHGKQCLQLVARDATARYALQRQAAQTQKLQALGQMAAGVAHDFNNALMAIVGNLSVARAILTRTEGAPEALESAVGRLKLAEKAAMDAASTVRRLQIYSRPAPDVIEIVEVAELLREVRMILRPLWHDASRAHGKELRVEVQANGDVPVQASPAELREALTNLVTNAIHALPEGGTIRLGAEVVEGEAVITVADTGVGMPPQVVEKIFEPFFTTRGKLGTGLGLFVTAGIVAHHGGRIGVTSTPGHGTTFTMHFPLADAATIEVAAELPEIPTGLRALLVEDELPVREATAGMLESAGLAIDAVADGRSALEALARASYDLVITDLAMPGMTGAELAREMKQRVPDLPIIVLSGWLGQGDRGNDEPELRGIVAATIHKPLQLAVMLHAINTALGRERTAAPAARR